MNSRGKHRTVLFRITVKGLFRHMKNTINLQIGSRKINVETPESWDDLAPRDFLLFYSMLFSNIGDEFTQTPFTALKIISMAKHILKMSDADMILWENSCKQDEPEHGEVIFLHELRTIIHACIEGLFDIHVSEENETSYSCKLNRTKNLYPSLAYTPKTVKKKPGKTTYYYAPADGLENLSIYELGYTFTLFEQYLSTNDEQFANELIAVLYRPSRPVTAAEKESDWGADRRQKLRGLEHKVAERAKIAATLSPMVKRVLLFWFASCRQQIILSYPKVFKKAGTGSNRPDYGWSGVLLSLAGGPVGLDAVSDQHYSNALVWLSMKEDEARDL